MTKSLLITTAYESELTKVLTAIKEKYSDTKLKFIITSWTINNNVYIIEARKDA